MTQPIPTLLQISYGIRMTFEQALPIPLLIQQWRDTKPSLLLIHLSRRRHQISRQYPLASLQALPQELFDMIIDLIFSAHNKHYSNLSYIEEDAAYRAIFERMEDDVELQRLDREIMSNTSTLWVDPSFSMWPEMWTLFGLDLVSKNTYEIDRCVNWLVPRNSTEKAEEFETAPSFEAAKGEDLAGEERLRRWKGMNGRFDVFKKLMGWKMEPRVLVLKICDDRASARILA